MVLLPEPLGPSRPKTSPRWMVRFSPSRAQHFVAAPEILVDLGQIGGMNRRVGQGFAGGHCAGGRGHGKYGKIRFTAEDAEERGEDIYFSILPLRFSASSAVKILFYRIGFGLGLERERRRRVSLGFS